IQVCTHFAAIAVNRPWWPTEPKVDFHLPQETKSRYHRAMYPSRTDELEEFKSQINFCEYAASRGFALDRRLSSRSSAVMRHPSGDKIIVARQSNRHWIYFNVHDSRDRG